MLSSKQEIFNSIELISIFFILLIAIIIVTAVLYHNRKKVHKIDLANFQNILLKAQFEVQEQTMQTIGADLHDNIGQLLSLTSLTLNSIELANTINAGQKIETAIDLTVRSIKEMRLLGKLLQGDQLIVAGLPEAIRYQIAYIEKSGKHQVNYNQADELPAERNADKDLIIFRVLQEALNNIIKHAAATQITIDLGYTDSVLKLNVIDNGIGFDIVDIHRQGMGLQNIRKRTNIIKGYTEIRSTPGAGTEIIIIIPYP